MSKPKILFLDIETSPKEFLGFGVYDQNFAPNQLKKDTTIFSYAARFRGEKKMYCESSRYRRDPRDDKNLLKSIYKLIEKADIVVAHNGDKFDIKQLRTRFIKQGLKPQRRPKSYDTLKIARREFGFTFNKLEYLADYLELPIRKLTQRAFNGFTLWDECLKKNQKAWNEMIRYNKQDVEVLELVWDRLAPWAGIDHSVYNEGEELCSCGSVDFRDNGNNPHGTHWYKRRRCVECGNEIKGAKIK